jgi:hypothetical protein
VLVVQQKGNNIMHNLNKLLLLTATFITLSAGSMESLLDQLKGASQEEQFTAAQELEQMEQQNPGILGEDAQVVQRALVEGCRARLYEPNAPMQFAVAQKLWQMGKQNPEILGEDAQAVQEILVESYLPMLSDQSCYEKLVLAAHKSEQMGLWHPKLMVCPHSEARIFIAGKLEQLELCTPGILGEHAQGVRKILIDSLSGTNPEERFFAAQELEQLEMRTPGILGEDFQRVQQALAEGFLTLLNGETSYSPDIRPYAARQLIQLESRYPGTLDEQHVRRAQQFLGEHPQ